MTGRLSDDREDRTMTMKKKRRQSRGKRLVGEERR